MVPAWISRDENRFAFFRCRKEQGRLVGQQQELAAAIAPALPPLLAGFQVDAGQQALKPTSSPRSKTHTNGLMQRYSRRRRGGDRGLVDRRA